MRRTIPSVESRDQQIAAHHSRVSELAVAIAGTMGLPADARQCLRVAALCHDIGAVHIRPQILLKPGSLTAGERMIVHSHPEIGFEMLSRVEFAWPIGDIILQHHERLDGSGYPRHLMGEDIRIEARVLAVADVIDAMSAPVSHRPVSGRDAAIREIRNNRGILYDSQVVDAYLDGLDDERIGAAGL